MASSFIQVGDHVEVPRKLVGKVDRARDKTLKKLTLLKGLANERNTWRLMWKLDLLEATA